MRMIGAKALIECLKREHVEVVFGYPGGSVLTLYNELYKSNIPHVLTGHEQGAVHAADGYARATGRTGVCFATSGPGVCNMVTGIATAYMDSIPLVVFSGQVATNLIGRDSFQEADISGITTPITKHNYLVKNVKDLPRVVREAFYIAGTGRPGPVLVDIAKDVFDRELEFEYPETVHLRGYNGNVKGREEDVVAAVEALRQAKKPLFLTGGGVITSGTSALVCDIVKKTGIPVVTTLMGKGCVPDTWDLHLGMAGMHGSYAANMAITDCDLLVAVGARFDDRVTGDVENFAPNARIVHFDIDKVEINKIVHADISVNGDLRWSMPLFADRVLSLADDWDGRFASWRNDVLARKAAHPFASRPMGKAVTPQLLFEAVQARTDADTIAVTDVGQHQMWAAQFYQVEKPRHFVTSGGLGTMGYGLPAAMGAKLGRPQNTVVLFTGDGSILMNCQEFSTLHRYNVEVKVIVFHNKVLGMVNQWQRLFYNGVQAASVIPDFPDMDKVSAAMGVPGFRVTSRDDLEAGLDKLFQTPGPALLDVLIPDEEKVYPMVPGGKRLDEMILGETEGGTAK
ncbi:MAG: biosynthetic-type acetolactate synthase large subunit [Succiniclasticum sp.]|nr:biosynthetic-type acetolactate synthase large subunit [Succiniclasticum sp.]MEE3479947.1 biosynthetic-type acetolactate synthase large subunit [Succiniclasticum sp.]